MYEEHHLKNNYMITCKENDKNYSNPKRRKTKMLDCWLEVSMHLEGPATGHLDTGFFFFGFPVFKQMLRLFLSFKLSQHSSHAALTILIHRY
jgi:hypothetical protein